MYINFDSKINDGRSILYYDLTNIDTYFTMFLVRKAFYMGPKL